MKGQDIYIDKTTLKKQEMLTGYNIKIKVNGITVCYDDLGEGNTPIIFIHGFPFNKSSWQPQIDFLKNINRVIAYDIRGYGESTINNEKLSIGLFADDLIEFMNVLQIKKAIVCGLSMGGYILLNAMHRYPSRFTGIILSDTQCIADSPQAKEKRNQTIKQIELHGINNFASTYLQNIFCIDTLNEKNEITEKIKKIILSTSQETIVRTLDALANRHEMCSWLNKISAPALILCGKNDAITPPTQSEFLRNKISNSTFHCIDKAGHLANLEQPEEFNNYLNSFLSSIEKIENEKKLIKIYYNHLYEREQQSPRS